jgi:hypothetical protein
VFALPILTPALVTEFMTKAPSDFLRLQLRTRGERPSCSVPPRSVMKSRRCMRPPTPGGPLCATEDIQSAEVRQRARKSILQPAKSPDARLGHERKNSI